MNFDKYYKKEILTRASIVIAVIMLCIAIGTCNNLNQMSAQPVKTEIARLNPIIDSCLQIGDRIEYKLDILNSNNK